jgi:hypothetical protein
MVGNKEILDIHLQRFREVYTSTNWLLRIYKVLPEPGRQPKVKNGIEGRELLIGEPEYPEGHEKHLSGGYEYDVFAPKGI